MSNIVLKQIEEVLDRQEQGRNAKYKLSDIPEAHLIPGMKEASAKIIEIFKKKELLLLVGDYDADGIFASSIFIDFCRLAGFGDYVDYIVPDRFVDGYGVSKNMVNYASLNNFKHIITVDNGIGAKEATDYAKEVGIETVIITDHHTPKEDTIPDVDIIVDLKLNQGDFPFVDISGATIAWYLCVQIREDLNLNIDMRQWLDLVAITVISDVMPLQDINLAFYTHGIELLRNSSRPWVDMIFESNTENITEADLGFRLVPMINAIGRLDHAKHAIEMVLSKERSFMRKKVEFLLETNNKRKIMTESFLHRVSSEAASQFQNGDKAIILFDDDLHEGIVGIIAGKIAETYQRTAFVFTWNRAKQCWKGSGRTSGAVHLYNMCLAAQDSVLGFGGHAGAIGVALTEDQRKEWIAKIKKEAKKNSDELFLPLGEKPFIIDISDITEDLYNKIDSYRPFGNAFPEPLFRTEGIFIASNSYGMSSNHWKGSFSSKKSDASIQTWFFHNKDAGKFSNKNVDITFKIVKSSFKGEDQILIHGNLPK